MALGRAGFVAHSVRNLRRSASFNHRELKWHAATSNNYGPNSDVAVCPNGEIVYGVGIRGWNFIERLDNGGRSVNELSVLNSVRVCDGSVHFAFRGQPSTEYVIQASTNLSTWASIAKGELVRFPNTAIDTNSLTLPQRFYRIRTLP